MLIVGAVIQFKILSDIIITILCAALVFQSTCMSQFAGNYQLPGYIQGEDGQCHPECV
jgi:hypothetical protein